MTPKPRRVGTGTMSGASKRHKDRRWLGVLPLTFVLMGLLVATVWDADGDPATDNLPPATLTVAPCSVGTVDEEFIGASDTVDRPRHRRPFRPVRRRHHVVREWCWRLVAIPSQGP